MTPEVSIIKVITYPTPVRHQFQELVRRFYFDHHRTIVIVSTELYALGQNALNQLLAQMIEQGECSVPFSFFKVRGDTVLWYVDYFDSHWNYISEPTPNVRLRRVVTISTLSEHP